MTCRGESFRKVKETMELARCRRSCKTVCSFTSWGGLCLVQTLWLDESNIKTCHLAEYSRLAGMLEDDRADKIQFAMAIPEGLQWGWSKISHS